MKNIIKNIINRPLGWAGLQVIRKQMTESRYPLDYDEKSYRIMDMVRPYTMCGNDGIYTVIQAVNHVISNNIKGDIVECGVWRGGCSMAMAQMLVDLNSYEKKIWLFDTFEGMTTPTQEDIDKHGVLAQSRLSSENKPISKYSEGLNVWCYASIDDVKSNMSQINYPSDNLKFVKGDILETLPKNTPDSISILRLDTDWYQSTKFELKTLYPKLVKGGILIIDDYADWQGAKKAVDEFFSEFEVKPFMARVDGSRVAVKI